MNRHKEKKAIIKIGNRIRKIRIEQKISQEQLAFETDMPRVQIGRIERGEINTTIGAIITICRAMGIHPKELLDFEI